MKFELVHTGPHQRFYKSDEPIKIFPRKSYSWENEVAEAHKRVRPEYELLDTDECTYVCVSDAHTHIERLVFGAGRYRHRETGEIIYGPYSMLHMAGYWTFKIHGGSHDAVWPDKVYLRQLSILNSKSTTPSIFACFFNRFARFGKNP